MVTCIGLGDRLLCAGRLGSDLGEPAFTNFIRTEFGPKDGPFSHNILFDYAVARLLLDEEEIFSFLDSDSSTDREPGTLGLLVNPSSGKPFCSHSNRPDGEGLSSSIGVLVRMLQGTSTLAFLVMPVQCTIHATVKGVGHLFESTILGPN